MNDELHEIDSLLLEWDSGALDEPGIERLRELLRSSSAARAHFVRMQMLTAALHAESDAGLELSPGPAVLDEQPSDRQPNFGQRIIVNRNAWLAIAASLAIALQGAWLIRIYSSGDAERTRSSDATTIASVRDASQERTARGVATLTRLVDVVWQDEQPPLESGDALSPGRFSIQAGHAQVEFYSGATLVVEGPAELDLVSPSLARVLSGRLRAHVPPAARGFSLEVNDLTVVDLRTEFGLSVAPDGADVQVFDGEVELHRGSETPHLLTAGEAVIARGGDPLATSQSSPESFVDIAGLASKAELQQSDRYDRWRSWSAELRRNPRLIAYYSFDQPDDWQRRLSCSNEPRDESLDGAIVGAQIVDGRWAAKRAVEFKQPADRVRVDIPGEFRSLTFACWARIDSLDRWYNSIFLTDGYDNGEPHWQILDDGSLYFSVRPVDRGEPGPTDFKAISPSFWQPSLAGKWIHLAVSCDVQQCRIVHYLNGEPLSSHTVPRKQMPQTTRIGVASIGNWALPTLPEAEFAIRNLNGSIDELIIYSEALNASEVQEMYLHGKP